MNEAKRTKRIQTLIECINSGKDVALRDLELALTSTEWGTYQANVEQVREMKKMLIMIPERLKKYSDLLKKADLLHTRAKCMYPKGNPQTRIKLYEQSENAYEKAIEYLSGVVEKNPELIMWLDREFSQKRNESCSLEPTSAPRLINSMSTNRENGLESLTKQKRSLKLSALQDSLDSSLHPINNIKAFPQYVNHIFDVDSLNIDLE